MDTRASADGAVRVGARAQGQQEQDDEDERAEHQPRFRLRTEGARERDVFRHLHPWVDEHKHLGLRPQAFLSGTVDDGDDGRHREPHGCPDTALVAFAQLCALRLRARRCFVSLISSNVEYVLAESTRTVSLQYASVEDSKDIARLGTCSFLRDQGLNALALDDWRKAHRLRASPEDPEYYYTQSASPHWQIISDIRGHEHLSPRSFVKANPAMRFYASIPLRGDFGSVLGALAIADDAPRYGLSAAEMTFMEDIADTITQHLGATVLRSQRQRSERLVQSLGLFNSGKSSLRHWWLKQDDSRMSKVGRHKVQQRTSAQRRDAATLEFGVQGASSSSSEEKERMASSLDEGVGTSGVDETLLPSTSTILNTKAGVARNQAHITGQDFAHQEADEPPKASTSPGAKSVDSDRLAGRRPGKKATFQSDLSSASSKSKPAPNEAFDLATATQRTFARASNLLREALSADGVVFVNAGAAGSELRGGKSHPSLGHSSSSASDRLGQIDNDTSDVSTRSVRSCTIDAFSTASGQSSLRNPDDPTHHFEISETFLASLIRKYPQGHVFNFTQDGASCTSSSEESMTSAGSNTESRTIRCQRKSRDEKQLGETMAGARTVAFYPIWDEHRSWWSSGIFVWCTSPLLYFDQHEDITYLAAWAHSILAELDRLQIIAADTAKGSFISSVSHELRSPLHGVLGGVEFLQESELTTFQQEMADTIRVAGRTLLDTVDHILDYSKMSSFTRTQRRERAEVDASRHLGGSGNGDGKSDEIGMTSNVDLARLTEEVVETLASAYRFQDSRNHNDDGKGARELSLVVNVPWRGSWVVALQPGGWTRILNNLVGNSLKYTQSGHVSVRIEVLEEEEGRGGTEPGPGGLHSLRLIVQDTGIGMSQNFLSSGLYTPFKQADSHSPGTGLGLSIVRQICKDMGAELNVSSELGQGTRATIDFEVKFVDDDTNKPPVSGANSTTLAKISSRSSRGLNVDYFHWITSDVNSASMSPVGRSVCETATDWLDCEAGQQPSSSDAEGEPVVVYAIIEDDLQQWMSDDPENWRTKMMETVAGSSHVLVLAGGLRSVASKVPLGDLPFTPVYVHQPIGPRKLLQAITSDRSSTQLVSTNNERRHSIATSLSTPTYPIPRLASPSQMAPDNNLIVAASAASSLKGTAVTKSSVPSTTKSIRSNSAIHTLSTRDSTISTSTKTSPSCSASTDSSPDNAESEPSNPTAITPSSSLSTPPGSKVLLVEDNAVNMKLLTALMSKLSLPYTAAINGREALTAYRSNPGAYFLILMDMSMPVMDGFTATAKIRATEHQRKGKRCPIVALTGAASEEAKKRAFACGVDEFFSKPVQMREVRELVGRVRGKGGG